MHTEVGAVFEQGGLCGDENEPEFVSCGKVLDEAEQTFERLQRFLPRIFMKGRQEQTF